MHDDQSPLAKRALLEAIAMKMSKSEFLAWAHFRLPNKTKPLKAFRRLRNQANKRHPELHELFMVLVDAELVRSAQEGRQSLKDKDELLAELAEWWGHESD